MAYSLTKDWKLNRDWSCGIGSLTVQSNPVSLRNGIDNLNVDITTWFASAKNNPKAQMFAAAWVKWRGDTYKALQILRNDPDVVAKRSNELATWRAKWETMSGRRSTASVSGQTSLVPSSLLSKSSMWGWLAILGVGALGGLIVSRRFGV
jgi:hypothetical protein